jgi:WD40 repeat protein
VDGSVVIRDPTGGVEHSVSLPGEVLSVAASPVGDRVAAGGTGGQAAIVDQDGSNRIDVPLGDAWVQQVAFTPDGSTLAIAVDGSQGDDTASGPGSGEVRFVDAVTGAPSADPIVLDEPVIGVVYAPAGRQLAVIAGNNVVHVFDAATHQPVDPPIENVDALITSLAFSPDGRRIAVGVVSGVVRTYDAETHARVGDDLEGDPGGIFGVAYSPDGSLLAGTTLGLSTTLLWDAVSGNPLGDRLIGGRVPYSYQTFLVEHFMGARPAFSPDGRGLVTPGFPGATVLWDLDQRAWRSAACAVVGRDLTEAEWERYLPGRAARPVCPQPLD